MAGVVVPRTVSPIDDTSEEWVMPIEDNEDANAPEDIVMIIRVVFVMVLKRFASSLIHSSRVMNQSRIA